MCGTSRAAAASFIKYTIALTFTLTVTHKKNRFHILTIDTCTYMKQRIHKMMLFVQHWHRLLFSFLFFHFVRCQFWTTKLVSNPQEAQSKVCKTLFYHNHLLFRHGDSGLAAWPFLMHWVLPCPAHTAGTHVSQLPAQGEDDTYVTTFQWVLEYIIAISLSALPNTPLNRTWFQNICLT